MYSPRGSPAALTVKRAEDPLPNLEAHEVQAKLRQISKLNASGELSVRDIITLYALSSVISSESARDVDSYEQNAAAVLVQLIALRHSRLSQRSFPDQDTKWSHLQAFMSRFCRASLEALQAWPEDLISTKWDGFDLFDGRLFSTVATQIGNISLPQQVVQELAEISNHLQFLSSVDVSKYIPTHGTSPALKGTGTGTENPGSVSVAPSSVLAFSHPVLDEYLEKVKLETTAVNPPTSPPRVFQELVHWHNAKKSLDPKTLPRPKGFFARRREQKFRADTIAYSASLTGASGKNIDPEIIITAVAGKANSKRANDMNKLSKALARSKLQDRPMSGKEKALEQVRLLKTKKASDRSDAIINSWSERCSEFEKETSLTARYLKVDKYLLGLSQSHLGVVGAEVSLYLCGILWRIQDACKPSQLKSSVLALLWHRMMSTLKLNLTREVFSDLSTLSESFRTPLNSLINGMLLARPLPFRPPFDKDFAKTRLVARPLEFQILECGPYLERSFDSAPDERVLFEPDAWQRKVLNAIDAKRSLLVVAPTSAGKTFISFYAMKKTLQSNDDDILVYVAPTKALVNQIAAEIQARFTKSYNHSGRSVWAIHTRDYRVNNPTGCQVLVTVPSILQIMLLTPANEKSFSKRIKWIIFDEVHCIQQSDEGVIWEQLLLLAPCPLIALSATIGNPIEFKEWLQEVQRRKGFEFEMVMHSSRYSDLRKFYHNPEPLLTEFKGLSPIERLPLPGLDSGSAEKSPFLPVHPIGSIVDRSRETLADTSLEPSDCLSLWNCMAKHQNDQYRVSKSLSPEESLPNPVTKSDIVLWESALKDTLSEWISDSKSPFQVVQNDLRGTRWLEILSTHSGEDHWPSLKAIAGPDVSTKSVFSLVVDLRSSGALPAILFNYDRVNCEQTVRNLLDILEMAEAKFKENDPTWKAKIAVFEKWQSTVEASKRKAAKAPKTGSRQQGQEVAEGATKTDMQRDEANRETSKWASFDPEAPLPEFSFADTTKMTQAEFQERVDSINKDSVPPEFIKALRRGLGVHHAGMNRGYRQVVELLFRKGYLSVVVATGTLALGINMPCKTTVFTGDSVYLTALNYRQASGRAGRRGFDLLGNVVFHDMPPYRAFDIMSARLPDLRGQFPTSVTLVMRLFILLHGTENSQFASDAVKALLTQNRLFLGGPAAEMSTVHHLRFTIDYLQRQHLLSDTGVPINFCGLVGHLYYTENAVFAFHALLKEGFFHDLCTNINNPAKQQGILLEIVLVLCHLFWRIPCHRYQDEAWIHKVKRSSSVVLLPNLPSKAAEILDGHNRQTLDIFHGYVRSYAVQHLSTTPDNELPFTKIKVAPAEHVDLATVLPSVLPPTTVRSSFSALSGFQDGFKSIHELCETVRAGVFLEESAIPYIPIAPKETNGMPWNAYLLDFFKHGDMGALVRDNGIKGGDVWFRLKDFSLVLASIIASLSNFLDPNAEIDGAGVDMDDEMETGEFDEGEHVCEDLDKVLPVVSAHVVNKTPAAGKKKKVVVTSWEDESSDSDSDSETRPGAVSQDPSKGDSTSFGVPSWEEDGKSLKNVHLAFSMVQEQFERKFRKIFA